ncbi:MAG: AMP-binding protein [Paludibacteraceae bacterium]|nr:AMP-binding protein [Paludibacteraceae bacterium]
MFNLEQYGQQIAFISDRGDQISYHDLQQIANQIGDLSLRHGLLFCLSQNTLTSVVGYVAALQNHLPVVLLDASQERTILLYLIDTYHPEYLWLPDTVASLDDYSAIFRFGDYTLLQKNTISHSFESINPQLAVCLTTSGTTGSPKLVRLSQQNLLANAQSIVEYLHLDATERPLLTLPMYYSYGMSIINSHLLVGATILLSCQTIHQPSFWSFLQNQKATSFAGVPFTYETLLKYRFFRMSLPHLKTLTQAGGKLNADIVRQFGEYAQDNDKRFIVMYGQTEASPRMAYLPYSMTIQKPSSIGIPIPGGTLEIQDESGHTIHDILKDGELIYKGDNVCLGYAQTRLDLAKGDDNHGVLHTGDIAHKDADGYFYITGRLKRFVKVWGNRCNLDTLEQQIKTITPHCACVGRDDLIVVFLTETSLQSQVLDHLSRLTHLHPSAFHVQIIREIPYLMSGKVDYSSLYKYIS